MRCVERYRRWFALGLVCLTTLMIVLDGTIVNVALPVIQEDLGFSEANLAWVVNAYLLTFGGCMLLSGRLADLLGRRRVLMTGIALFTLASLVCGLANSQAVIVVARGVQGIGGSIVSSVSLSIVLVLFPRPAERARAMSVWGFVGSGGASIGVIAGGLLTHAFNWHWIFLVNVPIGALALLLARPLLPTAAGTGLGKGLDLGGTVAVIAAPVLAVYGIVNAGQAGWSSMVTLGCLAAALVTAGLFVLIERTVNTPLVPLGIFRSRTIVVTNVVTALSGAAFFGWFFFSALYAQHVLGYDALQTGLTFLPATLTMGALSLGLAAWIVARLGPKTPLVVGMALLSVGLVLFARAPVNGAFLPDILVPMFLLGLGAGVSFMPLFLIATADVSLSQSGLVSGLINTSQMIGGALGLALLAGLAAARTAAVLNANVPPLEALNDGYHAALLLGAGLAAITAVLAATQLRPQAERPQPPAWAELPADEVEGGELVGAGR
ncbi:MAG TPA: MFS transporter [Chloroflexota bacterium]|nr:MFS transporter [Chloroflexota bacterium]